MSFTGPIETRDPKVIREICLFRAEVWEKTGQLARNAFGEEGWRDAIDDICRHWVIRTAEGALAAAGRLGVSASLAEVHQAEEYEKYELPQKGPVAAPDRVVVCPMAQGAGLGRKILDVQEEAAVEAGARFAVRQASPAMTRLLTHRGWKMLGPASPDARFPGVVFTVAAKFFEVCASAA